MNGRSSLLLIAVLTLLPACDFALARDPEVMMPLAGTFRQLTMAVHGQALSSDPALDGAALLSQVRPDLREPFKEYTLRAKRDGERSSVLLCSASNGEALFEDAGCSVGFDEHHWKKPNKVPCEFTLDLATVCGR